MSKYSSWTEWFAIQDIDARLSALEAANKKDLTAHLYPNGLGVPVNIDPFRIPSTNAPPPPNTHEFAPTPEQREPGWYWGKWKAETKWVPVKYCGEDWLVPIPPKIIGPRIQEPGE